MATEPDLQTHVVGGRNRIDHLKPLIRPLNLRFRGSKRPGMLIQTMGSILSDPRHVTHDSPQMINSEDFCIAMVQNSSSSITLVPKKEESNLYVSTPHCIGGPPVCANLKAAVLDFYATTFDNNSDGLNLIMAAVSRALYNIPCPVVTISTDDGESGETAHGDLPTH